MNWIYDLLVNFWTWIIRCFGEVPNKGFSSQNTVKSAYRAPLYNTGMFFSSPDPKGQVSYCHHWASVVCRPSSVVCRPSSVVRRPSVRPLTFHILINSSEATGPIWTKLWWNGPWMAPYQHCVRWSRLPTKMAAKLKIEKRGGWNFNCPLLL